MVMELPQRYDCLHWTKRKEVREEYVRQQSGNCSHCLSPLIGPPRSDIAEKRIKKSLFPKSFFKWPIHLHHCHKTGWTIGAVHNHCNAVLWQYHGE
tara:strand:+ start:328 stop:615 length:288 start_codon:yes stop_codon:yes gene_type:complete